MSGEEIYHMVLHQWLTEDLKLGIVFLFSLLGEIAIIKDWFSLFKIWIATWSFLFPCIPQIPVKNYS